MGTTGTNPIHAENFVDMGKYGTKTVCFSTAVTGTDTDAALTPTTGTRFRLIGYQIHAAVTTVLAGTGTALFLCDMASGDTSFALSECIWPIAGFAANAAAGTVVRNDTTPVLIHKFNGVQKSFGFRSAAIDNQIKISANATLSTGVIQVSGVLFYSEEAA